MLVYPDKVAQGWDSSLAHLPYYNLRKKAVEFMVREDISFRETKTWFPNSSAIKNIELNECELSFSNKDLVENKYCFYSNVFNDVSDKDYEIIHSKWQKIYEDSTFGIRVAIFRNPEFIN